MLFSLQPPNNRSIYLRPSCHWIPFGFFPFGRKASPFLFVCVCVLRHAVGSYFFVVCWRRPQFAYRCDFCCKITSFSWYGQCNPINQSRAVIVQANGIQKTSIFDCRSNCQQIFRYGYLSIWWLLVFRSLVQKPNYQQGCHLFRLFADNSRILSKCSRQ